MDRQKIAKQGIMWNNIIIAVTVIYWLFTWVANAIMMMDEDLGILIFYLVAIIFVLVSIGILVFVSLMFGKLKAVGLKGGGLLLASAIGFFITTLVMLVLGFMLGIIMFVLSGMSIRQIKESQKQLDFESDLDQIIDL